MIQIQKIQRFHLGKSRHDEKHTKCSTETGSEACKWKESKWPLHLPGTINEDTKLEMDMVKTHCAKLSELIDIYKNNKKECKKN